MLLQHPFTTYTPYSRGATANLTGGQVLSITSANTNGQKAFIMYSNVDMYFEASNGNQTAGLTNPGVGSFRIPTGQYWIMPIANGSHLRFSPVVATGWYSLVFLS